MKSKNSESFYITQSYTNANGKSTSKTIRKLGTLAELSAQLHTDRDGVIEWANEQARLETLKYKSEKVDATVMIPFHSNRLMDYNKQKLFSGGYLFLQFFQSHQHIIQNIFQVLFRCFFPSFFIGMK